MKLLISILMTLFSLSSFAATWKPVAKTIDCPRDVEVLAKTGEKHVMVEVDGKKYQLNSDKDESFSEEALVSHQFVNEQEKMTLTLPGYVERNPPKFDIDENGKKIHCRMNLL
ncbi:MAG: hypothetical protein WDA09_04125 [Bacteriovoracaceae bacterium]